ncbi:MAG: hypothetical protein RIS86_221 [Planctomycetota bacterium]|jgi:hypothetical protein
MDPKAPDQRRLNQVQTQDLTESRVNDDFVFWLKKHGSNYLLVVLVAAVGVMGWNWWKEKEIARTATAWSDLAATTVVEGYEQLAKEHSAVPQAAMVAYLTAGDMRLRQLQTGELAPKSGDTPAVPLDAEGRKIVQAAADEDYQKAAEIAVRLAGGSRENAALIVLPTLFGRAAVAESRGDLEASRKHLEDAAALAGSRWPRFGEIADARIAGLVALANPLPLPAASELPAPAVETPAATSIGDDLFNQLIQEQATGADTGTQGGADGTPVADPAAPTGG